MFSYFTAEEAKAGGLYRSTQPENGTFRIGLSLWLSTSVSPPMPDTVLGPGDIALNKADKVPVADGAYSQAGEIFKKVKSHMNCKQI